MKKYYLETFCSSRPAQCLQSMMLMNVTLAYIIVYYYTLFTIFLFKTCGSDDLSHVIRTTGLGLGLESGLESLELGYELKLKDVGLTHIFTSPLYYL
jgi:hypothetical protein